MHPVQAQKRAGQTRGGGAVGLAQIPGGEPQQVELQGVSGQRLAHRQRGGRKRPPARDPAADEAGGNALVARRRTTYGESPRPLRFRRAGSVLRGPAENPTARRVIPKSKLTPMISCDNACRAHGVLVFFLMAPPGRRVGGIAAVSNIYLYSERIII